MNSRARALTSVALLLFGTFGAAATGAQKSVETDWPRQIETESGKLVFYQPQVESFDANDLAARAAVSWQAPGDANPTFGAVWLEAQVETDREERTVTLHDFRVTDVRFPQASEQELEAGRHLVQQELPRWEVTYPLDELLVDLDLDAVTGPDGLRHDPPRILLRTEPTVLVQFDGEPRFEDFEGPTGATLARAVNTPFVVVRDPSTASYWLSAGQQDWYRAEAIEGPWQLASSVPSRISQLIRPDGLEPETAVDPAASETPPAILVATEPTELIVTAGSPTWQAAAGTPDLLYLDNTDSDVFLEISSQRYYVLLSGRWYSSPAVADLDWIWVANDALPDAFADIDPESAVGEVLPHVAGTDQAREAILDATIPQTAVVSRDDDSFEVSYDGDRGAQFETIDGADGGLQAAVNTEKSVFKLYDRYYACEQGIWYESSSSTGPWTVATEVPAEIRSIPPSSPHHNVTYVNVYDVTPQTVVVGYTPGYTHSYVCHGSVVYGTGWYYRPWWGPWYYPRPWTWGVHVRYNPWYGWGFGLTYSSGPFTFSFGHGGWGGYWRPPYHGGWWGPGYYRPYPRPVPYAGYRKQPTPAIYSGAASTGRATVHPATRELARHNLYARPENRDRLADRPQPADARRPPVAASLPNDVLTDRQGNVYRRDPSGQWQQRDGQQWRPAEGLDRPVTPSPRPSTPSTLPSRPSTRPTPSSTFPSTPSARPTAPSTRPSPAAPRPGLEHDWSSRQRGASRSRQFQAARPPSRPAVRPARRPGG